MWAWHSPHGCTQYAAGGKTSTDTEGALNYLRCRRNFILALLHREMILWLLMLQYGLINKSARNQAEIEAFKNVRTAEEWLIC